MKKQVSGSVIKAVLTTTGLALGALGLMACGKTPAASGTSASPGAQANPNSVPTSSPLPTSTSCASGGWSIAGLPCINATSFQNACHYWNGIFNSTTQLCKTTLNFGGYVWANGSAGLPIVNPDNSSASQGSALYAVKVNNTIPSSAQIFVSQGDAITFTSFSYNPPAGDPFYGHSQNSGWGTWPTLAYYNGSAPLPTACYKINANGNGNSYEGLSNGILVAAGGMVLSTDGVTEVIQPVLNSPIVVQSSASSSSTSAPVMVGFNIDPNIASSSNLCGELAVTGKVSHCQDTNGVTYPCNF